jgi:hypothetical protein
MTENDVLTAVIAAWTVVRITHLAFAHLRAQRAAELKAGRP